MQETRGMNQASPEDLKSKEYQAEIKKKPAPQNPERLQNRLQDDVVCGVCGEDRGGWYSKYSRSTPWAKIELR